MALAKTYKGAVAAGHERTATAAAKVLKDGGNAFDAIVAAIATACVCEPILASLGGGGFLVAHKSENQDTKLYDFFAQTPLYKHDPENIEFFEITADFGPATQNFHIGAGAAATPGVIPGMFAIHKDLCSQPLGDLLAEAKSVAQNGYVLDDFAAYLLSIVAPIVTRHPDTQKYFAPNGTLLKAGDRYSNPELAQCFELIAQQGENSVREGTITQAIVQQNTEHQGQLSSDDFKAYKVIKRKPLAWQHGATTLALNPAPAASGTLIAFGLGFIAREYGQETLRPEHIIRVLEETNNARPTLQATIQQQSNVDTLTDSLTTIHQHQKAYRGTTHISVIDADGNAASATLTNGEGNGRIVENFGFMLNNMLGEEDVNPDGFHSWTPNTRLSSMMAPTLMLGADGDIVALGSGGSNRIRSAILQTIAHITQGASLEEAINAPRIHVEKCGTISYEDMFEENNQKNLIKAFPHAQVWPEANMFFGGVHAVKRNADGTFEAVGDTRRSGFALLVEG